MFFNKDIAVVHKDEFILQGTHNNWQKAHNLFKNSSIINLKITVKKKITVTILLSIRQLGVLLKITEQLRTMT